MDLYEIQKKLNMGIPLTNIKLRVTDYVRVSTDHIEQKKSLQNQQEHFEKFIKENPNWTYVNGYIDDGITGTSDIKRDNFMKMIEDAKKQKFDLIITKEISRFSRNTLDSIKYTRKLLSYGVAVLFVNDNINTALPDSELRLTIMASMAQDEIRRLSERVKFGMHRAMERGEILGNNLLYGYKKNKTTRNLEIIESEAKTIKIIYELYAIKKLSLSEISKKLNACSTKNFSKKWTATTVSRVIENPKYKGYYCAKKSEIIDYMSKKVKYFPKKDWIIYEDKVKIPPIIDENLWNRANTRLLERQKAYRERKKDKTFYENKHLYSAKIYCKEHNTIYYRRLFRKKTEATWNCSEYLKRGKNVCQSPSIREKELDLIFQDIIKKIDIDYYQITKLLINTYIKESSTKEIITKKKQELKQVLNKKDKLLELKLEENISTIDFYKKNSELTDIQEKIQQELLELLQKEKSNNSNYDNLTNLIQDKINSKETQNKIINLILDHIDISKINNDTNNINLDIYLVNRILNEKALKYEFKRGYDTRSTRRYKVYYNVNIMANNY